MKQDPDLIPLDTSVPFVRAICAVMDSRGDVAREHEEQAIAALVAAEERYGLRIVYEPVVGSRALGLVPRDPTSHFTMAEVMRLNQNLDELWTVYRDPTLDEAGGVEWGALIPFLSETLLLLDGPDFSNNHLVWYANGQMDSWSQRAWGRQLARWAEATDWAPTYRHIWDGGDLTYANFCFHLYQMLERYGPWSETVKRVIALKCARQLAVEAAGDGAPPSGGVS